MPPVQAGADGVAEFPLDLPDFNGQVRLMAVAWSGSSVGAAASDVFVRDPLVAEPLLPRFLAPGDQTRHDAAAAQPRPAGRRAGGDGLGGRAACRRPASRGWPPTLAPGAQALPFTTLTATGAGRGIVRLDVAGTGGFHIQRETAITVRPARGATTLVAAGELAPGAEMPLAPPLDRFVAGTWKATATFGGAVRYDVAGLVQALDRYPLWCLEQATSRGFPLALLPDGPLAGPDRAARLQQAVGFVLDRQRFDGGFGLWSASDEAEPWLSVYATEFLLRAREAGAAVPEQAMIDALKFVADAADEPGDKPEDFASQAYRLYVLALAGKGRPGAARVMAEQIDHLPTPLAKAQLGAALALAHDQPRAEAAFAAALAAPARRWWSFDYGTALRDQAAIGAAAEGERPARRSTDEAAGGDAGGRPGRGYVVARRSNPGRRRLARCWGATGAGPHRAERQRAAAGADGVGGADRTGDGAQSERQAGLAGGVGDRRPGVGPAGGAGADAGHPAVQDAGRAAAGSRPPEAEHGVRAGAGGQGGGRPAAPRHAAARPAGGVGDRRTDGGRRCAGDGVARQAVGDRGAAGGGRPVCRGGGADAGEAGLPAGGPGARGDARDL